MRANRDGIVHRKGGRIRPGLAVLLLAAAPLAGALPSADERVGFDGVGAVRVGMDLWRLLEVLGEEVRVEFVDNDCTFVVPQPEGAGIAFMITRGSVARVDVSKPGLRTLSGVGVGDAEEDVRRAYGERVATSDHAYEEGHYLTVTRSDGRAAVVFETDGRVVTSYRIGRLPEAGWIEGCS